MSIGHFLGGIGAVIWRPDTRTYLVLQRASTKDVGAGHWECITGRVDQGEGFEAALHREVYEELGVAVEIQCILGTSHFHRGDPTPDNELLGVIYLCTTPTPDAVRIGPEHDQMRWLTAEAVHELVGSANWLTRNIDRAEYLLHHQPPAVFAYFRQHGYETS